MKKLFKHSGAVGDLIYGLAVMKHFGGGDLFLHLNQLSWIGQHYYNSPTDPYHKERMNKEDFEYMRPFMESLPYIKKFDIMSNNTESTHNLDRFRPLFVGHPGNYVDIYAAAFGNIDPAVRQ
jgi:hypothetical protein